MSNELDDAAAEVVAAAATCAKSAGAATLRCRSREADRRRVARAARRSDCRGAAPKQGRARPGSIEIEDRRVLTKAEEKNSFFGMETRSHRCALGLARLRLGDGAALTPSRPRDRTPGLVAPPRIQVSSEDAAQKARGKALACRSFVRSFVALARARTRAYARTRSLTRRREAPTCPRTCQKWPLERAACSSCRHTWAILCLC